MTTATKKNARKNYDIVSDKPVARFYYQGQSHEHPVRRTVLVIEDLADKIVGYEVREGSTIRDFKEAPIKSYRKDRIAKYGDRVRLRRSKAAQARALTDTTLQRFNIMDLLRVGA